MYSYRAAGLVLASDIQLHGLIAITALGTDPDVRVRLDDAPDTLVNPQHSGPNWQFDDSRFLLKVPKIGRFLITGGRDVAITPVEGVPSTELAVFVSGTVLGILMHQRARIVLHASAIKVGDRAVLFCGESGAGKSTLAAALSFKGYPIIADDVCTLGFDAPGAPDVFPDGRNLKLWTQAIEHLNLERGPPVRDKIEKFYIEPLSALCDPASLGAIYVLRAVQPHYEAGIEQPNVVDSALLLKVNAYRPRLVKKMNQDTAYFIASARIAETAGVFYLTREIDLNKMDEVIVWLEAHWRKIGILPQAV